MALNSRFGLAALLLTLAIAAAGRGDPGAQESAEAVRPPMKDPTILLVRDAVIRGELNFSSDTSKAVDELLQKHNGVLMALRDVGPTGGDEAVRAELLELRDELKRLLDESQRARLQGLVLQAQGYDALTRDDIAKELKFTPEQRKQLTSVMDGFWKRTRELQRPDGGQTAEALKGELDKLQAERLQQILKVLDDRQSKQWSAMLGPPFDFSTVRPSPALAPEFESVDEWVNSPPLTLESLRGQVVVVHFFAFGCSNCINNYPWYREWYDELAGQGVTIVGIHTPETQAETDNGRLRESLTARGLKFPVAVDKTKKNWEAWHNSIWPTVYLVDKQGRLRYWWYGELDWQGAGGQKVARQQIEQLLAEKDEK